MVSPQQRLFAGKHYDRMKPFHITFIYFFHAVGYQFSIFCMALLTFAILSLCVPICMVGARFAKVALALTGSGRHRGEGPSHRRAFSE
jgi:hypothetical protein